MKEVTKERILAIIDKLENSAKNDLKQAVTSESIASCKGFLDALEILRIKLI